MADDAGGRSADEESADEADGSTGGEVEPEVEPQVDPEIEPGDEGAPGDDAGDDGSGSAAGSDDGSGSADPGDDESDPIGAVTDPEEPPAASGPDLDGEAGADASGDADEDGGSDGDVDEDAGPDVMDADEIAEHYEENAEDESYAEAAAAEAGQDASAAAEAEPESTDAEGSTSVNDDWAEETVGPQPYEAPDDHEPGEPVPEGPPDDEEMPLADHVEEMVLRLTVVAAVAAVVAGGVFFFEPLAEDTIMFLWESVLPDPATVPDDAQNQITTNPRVYGPLELKLAELKLASLAGFVVALPVFVYETYRFMRPGLYPHERRYYLASVPTSLVLAIVGVAFAYFIILPAIFAYFVRYSERAGQLAFALRQTFDLIVILMGYMALVFQIPLFIMLAIMMGLTDRQWLESRRLYFWGGFLGVSFVFVPEPTGMAPILVALTMIGLFEGTLALLRWTGN